MKRSISFLAAAAAMLFLSSAYAQTRAYDPDRRTAIDRNADSGATTDRDAVADRDDSVAEKDIGDLTWRLGVGYRFGWMTTKNPFKDHDRDANAPSLDMQHSVNIVLGLNRYLAIQAEGAFMTNKDFTNDFYTGIVDLEFRLPMYRFVPYVAGGAGVEFNNFRQLKNRGDNDWEDFLVWRGRAGIEYFFSRHFAWNVEAAYVDNWRSKSFRNWSARTGPRFYF